MPIQPKDLELKTASGTVKTFVLHKFPAISGREIIAKYPVANMPKLGDYGVSEETMLKLIAFVGVRLEGRDEPQLLTTRDLVNNHVEDWETLARLEWAMLEYNCSFFGNGTNSTSFEDFVLKAQPLISKMLTAWSGQSLEPSSPPSTS